MAPRSPISATFLIAAAASLCAQEDWRRIQNISSTTTCDLVGLPGVGPVTRFESFERLFAYENHAWRALAVADADTSLRGEVLITFDPKRNRLLAYRSDSLNPGLPSELWSWNGAAWRIECPAPAIFESSMYAFLYDANRSVAIAFGSLGPTTPMETHEWDGTAWTRTSIAGPPARGRFAATWDATRGVVVMFGGWNGTSVMRSDLWDYDGVRWVQRTPAGNAPTGRRDATFVHRPGTGRTLLFGGSDSAGQTTDMWEWDGIDWHQVPGAVLPEELRSNVQAPAAVWDDQGSRVLAQLGTSLFSYDGSGWSQITPATILDQTLEADYGFAPHLGRVIALSRDWMWSFDGRRWWQDSQVGANLGPHAQIATDTLRNRVVLFGGNWAGDGSTDTWEWDGSTWSSLRTATRPLWRGRHAMEFDPVRGHVVMFGGTQYTSTFDETWTYDGGDWTRRTPLHSPPARYDHGMAFDPNRGRMVVYGGRGADVRPLHDTWEWDGTDWIERTPTMSPDVELGRSLAYSPSRQHVLLFGWSPSRGRNETWAWDGVAWVRLTTANRPSYAVRRMALVYDPVRDVLIGSPGEGIGPDLAAVWEFSDRTGTASREPYGLGCRRTSEAVALEAISTTPLLGAPFLVSVRGLHVSQPAILNFGDSDASIAGIPLPIPLDALGAPGCLLWSNLSESQLLPGTTTRRESTLLPPNDAALVGVSVYLQAIAVDPMANSLGAATSNGLRLTLGVR